MKFRCLKLKIQIFLALNLVEITIYESPVLIVRFRLFFAYSDFLSDSFRFCVRSEWQVWVLFIVLTVVKDGGEV